VAEVRFQNVTKSYGAKVIIDRLNLTIPDRAFVVLVGPSGCGKSTTLRMIAGLEEVTTGDLLIGDRRVNDVAPKDRDIAMVFQSYALYPHMTIYDNIAFGLSLRKMPKPEIDQRVRDAAAKLGLTEYLQRRPKELSGGQRQRVAMGRAIVRKPAVFLFDEPLSNLDAKLRGEMRREIARLHRETDTTVVYVTHDQVEAMTLADQIVVMHQGLVQQVGSPLTLYDRPANRFVAEFIGSPQMNLLKVKAERADTGVVLRGAGIAVPVRGGFDVSAGQEVLVGIRPPDVEVTAAGAADAVGQGRVTVYEPMGAESFLAVETDAGTVTVRQEAHGTVRLGDTVALRFPEARLHVFAADSERSLRREADGATP
jgi:multiple sugar transport system ATP-binding protein